MSEQEGYKDQKSLIKAEIGITQLDLTAPAVSLSEVLDEIMPQGEEVKAADFVNVEIVIRRVTFFVGQFGAAAFVVFTDENGVLFNFVIGQRVVLPKLAAVIDRLPVTATLRLVEGGQFGEYYDIE